MVTTSKANQILEQYNPKQYGSKMRDFQPSWYKKYPWIHYSTKTKKVTCFPCNKYGQNKLFSFDNWKKTERLRKHSLSESHLLAMLKWADSKAATFKQNNILIQVRSQHAAEVADNRKYLKIMIENVSFLAKQNISFRGHKEKREDLTVLSSINRGNFLELVSLRSKDSGFLHGRLKSYFSKKGFGQWTSSKIQNEIIDLLASFTRKGIIQQINNTNAGGAYTGVIYDETSDIR